MKEVSVNHDTSRSDLFTNCSQSVQIGMAITLWDGEATRLKRGRFSEVDISNDEGAVGQ